MFVFIAGIGPRRKKLESQPRTCSNCGRSQAYLMRSDDYVYLFFIPVLRIRKGQPRVECKRCGHVSDESGRARTLPTELQAIRCSNCGRMLAEDFYYCPRCGSKR